jgi:hypothetical protein
VTIYLFYLPSIDGRRISARSQAHVFNQVQFLEYYAASLILISIRGVVVHSFACDKIETAVGTIVSVAHSHLQVEAANRNPN